MHIKEIWYEMDEQARAAFARSVDSSPGYLYLIVRGHRKASPALCQRLVARDPRLTLEALRPDVYGAPPVPAAAPATPFPSIDLG